MVDWNSPEELARNTQVFRWSLHVLLGLYLWEFVCSVKFDWDFLTRKRAFRWPLIFYFLDRYCLLLTLSGVILCVNTTSSTIDCQALFVIVQLCGGAAIGLASINFAIRTLGIWENSKTIGALLLILILGHWGLILQAGLVHAEFLSGFGCVITQTHQGVQIAIYLYSTVFDLVLLVLTAWKFSVRDSSAFSALLHHDSLLFIFFAFLFNLLASIFMCLQLNPVMGSIFNFPSAAISTIVATRSVRRFTNIGEGPPRFHDRNSTVVFRREVLTDHTMDDPRKSTDLEQCQENSFVAVEVVGRRKPRPSTKRQAEKRPTLEEEDLTSSTTQFDKDSHLSFGDLLPPSSSSN